MLLNTGEIGPPCGVPSPVWVTTPSCITPAFQEICLKHRFQNACYGPLQKPVRDSGYSNEASHPAPHIAVSCGSAPHASIMYPM